MNWEYGLPSELGPYTYFKILNNSQNDTVSILKRQLYTDATKKIQEGIAELSSLERIKAANDFIEKIAISERNKEMAAIRSYILETGKKFPKLQEFLDHPEMIYNDLTTFYTNLTASINEIRMPTQQYINELKRIKNNLQEGKKRSFSTYKEEDYRYKLVDDITSFLYHLTGNEHKIKEVLGEDYEDSQFTLKVQNIAMRILEKSNLIQQVDSGENFLAIAANLLTELEQQIQQEVDKSDQEPKNLNLVSDKLLDRIEQQYLKQLKKNKKKQTPVQKALTNIQGIDFNRIILNAKDILGIKDITFPKKKLDILQNEYLNNIDNQELTINNSLIKNIRSMVNKNQNLSHSLKLTQFSISGSTYSKQGNIAELILSMIGSKVKKNVATDVITYKLSWKNQVNLEAFDTLINNIGDQFSSVLTAKNQQKIPSERDIREAISTADNAITKLLITAEKQLKSCKEFDQKNDLFIFHESVKLYSSVETGRKNHEGFGGRTLNILSYIDYLTSASNIGSQQQQIDRDLLAFLGRNLLKNAVGASAKGPLEKYFSIYAGMIMFDDVIAMAREMTNNINSSNNIIGGKIRQVHLYNLNGIYVPASMLLSHVSSILQRDTKSIFDDLVSAQITVTPIKDWGDKNKQYYKNFSKRIKNNNSSNLSEADWQAVTSAAVAGTTVQIIFLSSFESFIHALLPE